MDFATELTEFAPRVDFGARLEPASAIIHGAGQDPQAFREYYDVMDAENLPPALFMVYIGARGKLAQRINGWAESIQAYDDKHLILQVGFSMTHDGHPEKHYEQDVAAGKHDDEIRAFVRELVALGHPVFLRIGYEFNGPWNGYEPESYVAAFQRVTKMVREIDTSGLIATVWCLELGFPDGIMDYYPGDADVDW